MKNVCMYPIVKFINTFSMDFDDIFFSFVDYDI